MTGTLDPLAASGAVVDGYRRYLRSLMPLRDPGLAAALERAIDGSGDRLTKGPLLETTPAYATGASIGELVASGVLDERVLRFTGPALPVDRPLYRHQEQAIRRVAAGRNLVVATGTGSGKTESFLLPILSHLAAESAAGTLGRGVRALLLYPMNALADDQAKRLRTLLADVPEVTFGRYTGETKASPQDAEQDFTVFNPGVDRLPNEKLSRAEMQAEPPHLLLTTYAMLEHLLLRPRDSELFGHDTWRFVVVDEAHVYDGAKGAELAMLLRRLRDRVSPGGKLQTIATSAGVGAKEDPAAVTRFGENLFGLPFEWVEGDPARQDLVTASVVEHVTGPAWGPLDRAEYGRLADADDPAAAVTAAAGIAGTAADVLRSERRVIELREQLTHGPRPLGELAAKVVDGDEAALTQLVRLAGRIKDTDGAPVLSSRFHLFARATEGAFSCLGAEPHLSLDRHERCTTCERVVFELGGCRRCGAVHLHGAIENTPHGQRHVPWAAGSDKTRHWLLLDDVGDGPRPDDDPLDDEDDDLDDEVTGAEVTGAEGARRVLCVGCGALMAPGTEECTRPGCPGSEPRPVRLLRPRGEELRACGACGARGNRLVRLLESGSEAAVSVLGSALYQQLPPGTDGGSGDLPGAGRKLLFFSDSSQMAACFAPYLQDAHGRILRRRTIVAALRELARIGEDDATVDDLIHYVSRAAKKAGLFGADHSVSTRLRAAALWVAQELVATDDRQSLEGVGLMRVHLDRPQGWAPPAPLTEAGLSSDEAWDLLGELLRTVRSQGAMTMPEDVEHGSDEFLPRRGPIHMRGIGADARRRVLSWSPGAGTNGRADHLRRVLDTLGAAADTGGILAALWSEADTTAGPGSWFHAETVAKIGAVRRLDVDKIRVGLVEEGAALFRCDSCRRLAPVSVRGVCPTLRCTGALQPWHRSAGEERDHHRHLYLEPGGVPLTVLEHTARWTSTEAARIQADFARGTVNALSCSTTVELGVDVGDLQAVVLRTMPPTTADYVRRAGRAGRRTDSAALVLTYAQRRSHDLTRFAEPETMIAGEMRVPTVPLDNERIDRRHAHSVALAAFFRAVADEERTAWDEVGDFFLAPSPAPPGWESPVEKLRHYLRSLPDGVRTSLRAVLPEPVQREIGVADDDWVDVLLERVETARAILQQDVDAVDARRRAAEAAQNHGEAGRYEEVLADLRSRPLLNHLAAHDVLPEYGFPGDTVEMRTDFGRDEAGKALELTRDLSTAISEYAPGGQVIAGGMRWTSGGVYRMPGKDLVSRKYAVCAQCGHYQQHPTSLSDACPACATVYDRAPATYVVPAYGFVALAPEKQGATQAPQRSRSAATYIVEAHADIAEVSRRFPTGARVTVRTGARGEFVVINEGKGKARFRICRTCGYGTSVASNSAAKIKPKPHEHLLRDTECRGAAEVLALAHSYRTDFLELHLDSPTITGTAPLRSLTYALLEGAATDLEISRDDIDGVVHRGTGGHQSVVLFDTTPGGAGNALRIADDLEEVVHAAARRMLACECGRETSCYGCLRTYRNERFHEELSRGAALRLLAELVEVR